MLINWSHLQVMNLTCQNPWIALASRYNIPLQVCVAAALRRGVDEQQAKEQGY